LLHSRFLRALSRLRDVRHAGKQSLPIEMQSISKLTDYKIIKKMRQYGVVFRITYKKTSYKRHQKGEIMNSDELSKSVIKNRDTVFRVALGYVKNIHDADDIAQNVFMKLYKHKKGFVSQEAQKAWLIRVAVNESKDLLKSVWKKNTSELDESLIAPAYDDLGVYEYVKKLGAKYRTVIYLHYYEGYSTKEISRIMKIPQSTITTHLSRARKQLKENIESEETCYGRLQKTI
jgi:RNA polymerase sigma-70 factor (ECF subfamily)